MAPYQVLARKYRPQSFDEVLGQPAIVTTLKNAIKMGRLAHAYLFCGSRGTGKTTLARVFAKALNCQHPTEDREPCNHCSSCKEIAAGNSLDVLEIDGASHRGIDDIRQINETVGYSSSNGKYKIYIIDEVHMLTKEAFNALLKTLEEPPPKVLFIFATTEPHKVLPTILSRCQRFNLSRIPMEKIIAKLERIAKDLNIEIEDEALHLLAQRADGGLRDAESLFDQIIAFHEGSIKTETVADVLGIMPKDTLFALDQAGKEGNHAIAFEIAHQIFSQGKDITQFVESITEHFRTLLLIKISGINAPFLTLSETDKQRYENSSKIYTQEQCLTILDFLIEAQNQIRFQTSTRIALEAILLRIIRSHQRLPIEFLVRRLAELEQTVLGSPPPSSTPMPVNMPAIKIEAPKPPTFIQAAVPAPMTQQQTQQQPAPVPAQPTKMVVSSVTEDPTPSPEDLGIKLKPKSASPKSASSATPKAANPIPPTPPRPPMPSEMPSSKIEQTAPPAAKPPASIALSHKQHRYDTILQFTAVELEGTVQKKQINAY
jgi:DNA polymerase-3 subunit gamma/tau